AWPTRCGRWITRTRTCSRSSANCGRSKRTVEPGRQVPAGSNHAAFFLFYSNKGVEPIMWIKNLNVFQAEDKLPWTAAEIEAALNAARCPACGSQSLSTEGFAPPLKHAEAMVYSVDGLVFALHQEISRLLPAAV